MFDIKKRRIYYNSLNSLPTERNFKQGEIPLVFDLSERDVKELEIDELSKTFMGTPLRGMDRVYVCMFQAGNGNICGLATEKEIREMVFADKSVLMRYGYIYYGKKRVKTFCFPKQDMNFGWVECEHPNTVLYFILDIKEIKI